MPASYRSARRAAALKCWCSTGRTVAFSIQNPEKSESAVARWARSTCWVRNFIDKAAENSVTTQSLMAKSSELFERIHASMREPSRSALTAEREGSRIEAWIRSNSSDDFAISDWVVTEFSAALSMKLRTQQVDLAQRATALSLFSGFCIEKATVLPVEHQHFSAAARLADRYDAGIRAGDALHLASPRITARRCVPWTAG